MTWGLFRPVILVPAGSMSWSDEVKRSVLLHELGHIRRGDCLMLLMGRLACEAYWFHPLVWLAARQLRKTSEQAADNLVLASNIAPPDYAEHLVGIAAQMRGFRLFGHVALPMASPSDLEGRVRAILDPRRNHRSLKRRTCYALMALALLFLIPCAILRLGYAKDKKPQQTAEKQQGTDDSKARPELAVAEARYNAAKAKAEDDIRVRYAIAAADVTKSMYECSKQAGEDSVGKEYLNELRLKCEEYDLAVEKARLEHRLAGEEAKIAKAEFEKVRFPDDRKLQRVLDVAEAEARYSMAKALAEDDINVRYATAAAKLAKARYEDSKKALDDAPGSVTKEEVNGLMLKSKQADLAVEKAKFDQRIAGEEAKVAKAELEAAKHKAAEEQPAPAPAKGTGESAPAKAETTGAATPETAKTVTFSGVVVDRDGQPVAGAVVRALAFGEPALVAQSDALGRF